MKPISETYFSFDIECDGPYPGYYSMLSIGMVACATFDGKEFERLDLDSDGEQFYSVVNPITRNYVQEAVEICAQGGVNRSELVAMDDPFFHPKNVIARLEDFVATICKQNDSRAIAVAYPLGFDWMWLYWYECAYGTGRKGPFGFSGCLDIKTMYQTKKKTLVMNSTKRQMPKKILSKRPHSHNALDDAIEQAEMFCNIWEWNYG